MEDFYDSYKRGLFSYKLCKRVAAELVPIKFPKKSKVRIKAEKNSFSIILPNGERTEKFDGAWFSRYNQNILRVGRYDNDVYPSMLIDCLTGVHTPVCYSISGDASYVVSRDTKKIYKVNYENGLEVEETNLVLKSANNFDKYIVCEDDLGNKLILNSKDLSLVKNLGPIEDAEVETYDHISNLEVISYGNRKILVSNNEAFAEFECNKIEYCSINGDGYNEKILLRIVDEAANKTKMIVCDWDNPKSYQVIDLDYLSSQMIRVGDRMLFECQNKEGKWGYVDQNKEVVISFEYKLIEYRFLMEDHKVRKNIFIVYKDGMQGVKELDGKEVLPCKYQDIDTVFSAYYKDKMRFLAKNENGLWGVIDSNGKVEVDFIYNRDIWDLYHKVGSLKENKNIPYIPDKIYYSAIAMDNTKTGKTDYLVINKDDCIIEADDADVKRPRAKRVVEKEPNTVTEAIVDFVSKLMGEEPETTTVEDDDEMSY